MFSEYSRHGGYEEQGRVGKVTGLAGDGSSSRLLGYDRRVLAYDVLSLPI